MSDAADLIDRLQARVEELEGALANTMGFLDTPIARRKLGVNPDADWVKAARAALKQEVKE